MVSMTKPGRFGRALALIVFLAAVTLFIDPPFARPQCSSGVHWKQIGPSPLISGQDDLGPDAGEVVDIAIDPRGTTDQTIFIAVGSGGIWKTTNRGTTWTPTTDLMKSLSMGAVALDPWNPSIVYAGTGNFQVTGGDFSNGVGIYKSLDGGATWPTTLGATIFTGVAINRIVLPAPNVLLVATGSGLYRSENAGTTFGNDPLFSNNNPVIPGRVTSLILDTATPTVVYAAISGSGVFKSTNSGASFPPSTNLFKAANGAFTANDGTTTTIGDIAFAQSTFPNNQTMYANVQLNSGGPQMLCSNGTQPPGSSAMLRSTNGGATWKYLILTGDIRCSYQPGYDQTVGVDPRDPKRVYIGMRGLFMATDGGDTGLGDANRIDYPKVHADQHALVFSPPTHRTGSPLAPTRFYTGTDGGIATNPDGGSNNWTILNGNASGPGALATLLLRQIDIGRGTTANNVYTYGAAQDNGISSHTPDRPGTPWHLGQGGDGWSVTVDPLDPRHANAMGDRFIGTVDGTNWLPGGSGLPDPRWLYFDPNGAYIYAIGNNKDSTKFYRSTDNGATFGVIGQFAASFSGLGLPINMVKADSNTIWVGLSDGTVWHTSEAMLGSAARWVPHLPQGAKGQVAGIAIDPSNPTQVVVVYPVGNTIGQGNVFMTTNNGQQWTNISGNLANLPLRAVVFDPNTFPHSIIVANDAGVMRSRNVGATWEALGAGLPIVQATALAIDSSAIPSLLRVGTYGRSAFELAYDRKYVDYHGGVGGVGTREQPFGTVHQAVNAPATGDTKYINIQSGTYAEGPITINQCVTLNAINGQVTIH